MKSVKPNHAIGELLNGRLPAAEAAACRNSCETPEGSAMLAWEGVIREAVRESADLAIDDRRGFSQVWARIEREQRARKPSRIEALLAALSGWFRASPAFAVACAVVAAQAVIIAGLWPQAQGEPEYAIVRALPGTPGGHEPFIRVSFSQDATERELRALLVEVSADIVAGPTQLGDYFLLVAPGKAPAAADALRGSPLVETAVLVNDLPSGE